MRRRQFASDQKMAPTEAGKTAITSEVALFDSRFSLGYPPGTFTLAGEGAIPKTFLMKGQPCKGVRL